jgi:uncharacterized protein (DUF433 family)
MNFEPTQTMPLTLGEDGTIRITGSRVTLDTIVDQFLQGATAEQIQEDFPSLSLRDVYGAISYYLQHTAEVETYLEAQAREAHAIRVQIEADPKISALRKRLREIRDRQPK